MAHSSLPDPKLEHSHVQAESLAKRMDSSVIFPQISQRLLPISSPHPHRDSNETLQGSYGNGLEEQGTDSIIVSAMSKVPQKHPMPQLLTEASALTPRRFGSVPEDEADAALSEHGSWGSDELLESGTDTWSIQDLDSNSSEAGVSDLDTPEPKGRNRDLVDGQLSMNCQLDPHSPDLVSDTFIDTTRSEDSQPFDDFVEVKWNAVKHPPPELPPCPPDLPSLQQKRRCIFENLISTENNYVATLEHIVENYDGKLAQAEPKILNKDDRRSIFYMVRHLLQIHRTFQISLHEAASRWDQEESVALDFTACFSRVTVRRVYSAYINNYDDAMERVKQLMASNRSFSSLLTKAQRKGGFRLPLSGLMVKPIQRFPQYILLLKDLLHNSPADHPQRFHLERALSDLQFLANFLNERKREAHQKTEARNLMRDLHVHFVEMSKEEKRRLQLLDKVSADLETYAPSGRLLSREKQQLALFNFMVLAFIRGPTGKYKVQWSSPLSSVTVQSCILTPDMKVSVRKNSIGSTVIQNRGRAASMVDGQVRQRYEELQALIHDSAVLMQISGLAATLQRRYRGFNELRLQGLCTQLQRLIQQKEDENRLTDSSFLELRVLGPPGNPPRSFLFDLGSPAARNSWVDRFMRQKLSEEAWNLPAWVARDEICDPLDPFTPSNEAPLFIKSAAVDISRNFGEVTCAIPVCLVNGTILKRHVWCGHAGGGISIFSLYTHKPSITQNFLCQDRPSFWCMELVPGAIDSRQAVLQADMVWAGTDTGHILVFSLLEQERRRPFLQPNAGAGVISLCYAADRVFAGLQNGLVVIYERDTKGFWYMRSPIQVGEGAVVKIVAFDQDGQVLIACDDVLVKIVPLDQGFAREPLPIEGEEHIQDFVMSGPAVWIAFQKSLILRLVHLKTRQLLQTVDLSPTINVVDDKQRDFEDSVTCLGMTKRLLLVGTRAGYLCKLTLQQAVPVSSGPCSVSYHKHYGAIRFIVSFQNMVERLVRSVDYEEEDIEEEDEIIEEEEEEEDEEEEINDEEEEEEEGTSRVGIGRKPSVDMSTPRRLSITPLKSKWMSNPNLLLSISMKALNEEEGPQFENLMVDIDLDDPIEESSSPRSRKNSQISQEPQTRRLSDLKEPVKARVESYGKMWLEDNLIVTGGLGYYDLKNRKESESEREPCLNCWCE